jgi:deoxyribonuclease V
VRLTPRRGRLRRVAGADVSCERGSDRVWAAVVLLSWPDLEPIETATAVARAAIPYVPGYLSFREGPVLDRAFARLGTVPDAVILDGQGLAHPRRFGLACHLGVLWDVPTVGCAKSRLIGEAETPGPRKGDWAPLVSGDERLGCVLRTRDGVKPVWVSPGHRMDQNGARELVLAATTRYRLPEPTRRAHGEVNALRRARRGSRPARPAGGASSEREGGVERR